jgi:hypothetical protein
VGVEAVPTQCLRVDLCGAERLGPDAMLCGGSEHLVPHGPYRRQRPETLTLIWVMRDTPHFVRDGVRYRRAWLAGS